MGSISFKNRNWAQLSNITVNESNNGEEIRVSKGNKIGVSGNTGNSSGPHLHLEIRNGNDSESIRTLPTTSWISGDPDNPCTSGSYDGSATGPAVGQDPTPPPQPTATPTPPPCAAPGLTAPKDGLLSIEKTVQFAWNTIGNCTFNGYLLRVKDTPDMISGGNIVAEMAVFASPQSIIMGTQWGDKDLYWSVRANNAPFGSNWAPARRFRVSLNPCPAPQLLYPVHGFRWPRQSIQLSWGAIQNCVYSGYEMCLFAMEGVSILTGNMSSEDCPITPTSTNTNKVIINIPSNYVNRPLWWIVRAANASNGARWSYAQSFKIDPSIKLLFLPSAVRSPDNVTRSKIQYPISESNSQGYLAPGQISTQHPNNIVPRLNSGQIQPSRQSGYPAP